MLFSDIFQEAYISLYRKKLRTFLTMVGIGVGVFTVFIIWSLSNGVQKFLESQLQGTADPKAIVTFPPKGIDPSIFSSLLMGNVAEVPKKIEDEETKSAGNLKLVYFNQKDVTTLESIPNVDRVSPSVLIPGKHISLVSGSDRYEVNLAPFRVESPKNYLVQMEIFPQTLPKLFCLTLTAKLSSYHLKNFLGKRSKLLWANILLLSAILITR